MSTLYQVKMGTPDVISHFKAQGDFAGHILMTTDSAVMNCKLTISLKTETALFLMNKILGIQSDHLREEAFDMTAELTNMIYGSARQMINRYGLGLKMSLPSVLRTKEEIEHIHGDLALVLPFTIKGDLPFWVELSLERNKKV